MINHPKWFKGHITAPIMLAQKVLPLSLSLLVNVQFEDSTDQRIAWKIVEKIRMA